MKSGRLVVLGGVIVFAAIGLSVNKILNNPVESGLKPHNATNNSESKPAVTFDRTAIANEHDYYELQQQYGELMAQQSQLNKSLSQLSQKFENMVGDLDVLKNQQPEPSAQTRETTVVPKNASAMSWDEYDHQLVSRFTAEPVDPEWSTASYEKLSGELDAIPGMLEINDLSCASTICRFNGIYDTQQTGRNDVLRKLETLAWNGEVDIKSNTNTGELTVYFAKPGHPLIDNTSQ